MQNFEEEILTLLKQRYPNAHTALNYSSPLELLVATILSAQCTDKRVNIVTENLFKKYKSAKDYADATNLQEDIKSINFYRNKAKNIQAMAKILVDRYNGNVPDKMDALLELPGVARKTANVVLGNAFDIHEGIVVDTHVKRVSLRLGLTKQYDPIKVEKDLVQLFPQNEWVLLSHLFIYLGRDVCKAPTPKCQACVLRHICPSSQVNSNPS